MVGVDLLDAEDASLPITDDNIAAESDASMQCHTADTDGPGMDVVTAANSTENASGMSLYHSIFS